MRVLGRRVVFYLITALAAITVDFFIPRLMPGNPVEAILARLQGQISTSTISSLEAQFGAQTKEGIRWRAGHGGGGRGQARGRARPPAAAECGGGEHRVRSRQGVPVQPHQERVREVR